MAYQIKVKDINGIIHTIETMESHAGKTVATLLSIAASALGVVASTLSIHSHGEKK
jgi:hypothetical protein